MTANCIMHDGCKLVCLQATGHDQAVGWAMVSLSSFLFVYYTVWVIVLVSTHKQFTNLS